VVGWRSDRDDSRCPSRERDGDFSSTAVWGIPSVCSKQSETSPTPLFFAAHEASSSVGEGSNQSRVRGCVDVWMHVDVDAETCGWVVADAHELCWRVSVAIFAWSRMCMVDCSCMRMN
jgi:hypothetical protein